MGSRVGLRHCIRIEGLARNFQFNVFNQRKTPMRPYSAFCATLFALVTTSASAAVLPSEQVNCFAAYPRHPKIQNLSRNWAKEYVGIDLVRDEFKNTAVPNPARIGIADNDFHLPKTSKYLQGPSEEFSQPPSLKSSAYTLLTGWLPVRRYHGARVLESMFNAKTGSNVMGKLVALSTITFVSDYTPALQWMLERKPDVINMSIGAHDKSVLIDFVHGLLNAGVQVVIAAGNYFYPWELDPNWHFDDPSPIQVGSLNENGDMDWTSGRGSKVAIFAPGSMSEQIVSDDPELEQLGKTSAAAPLVTGTIANMMSVNRSVDVLKVLLESSFDFGNRSHLNAYKAVMVAAAKVPTADFKRSTQAMTNPSTTCEDKKMALTAIRKIAFYHNSYAAWNWLGDFYESLGFHYDAGYYRRLGQLSFSGRR